MPEVVVGGRPYRPGAKNGKVLPAWQWMWDHLSAAEYTEGRDLTARAAARNEIKQSTLLTHLSRMASAGVLEVDYRIMPITVRRVVNGQISTFQSRQKCAFYRIKR